MYMLYSFVLFTDSSQTCEAMVKHMVMCPYTLLVYEICQMVSQWIIFGIVYKYVSAANKIGGEKYKVSRQVMNESQRSSSSSENEDCELIRQSEHSTMILKNPRVRRYISGRLEDSIDGDDEQLDEMQQIVMHMFTDRPVDNFYTMMRNELRNSSSNLD